jgi:hypothetical protein
MFPRARKEGLLIHEIGEELVVYDQKRHRAHHLNAVAAQIWYRCDGRTSVAELAETLEKAGPQKEDLVWLALERLEKVNLLQEPVPRPGSAGGISRRKMLRHIGLAGAFPFLVPVIKSITAPLPAIAQYGGGGMGGGGGGGGTCKAIFCCLCSGGAPPAPKVACNRRRLKGFRRTRGLRGTCVSLSPGGVSPTCKGQPCRQIATWQCRRPFFVWVQVGLMDSCPPQ